MSARYTEAAV